MPHGKDLTWLDEVRDEILEDQGLDDEDLPHLDEIDLEEIEVFAEQVAALDRKLTDENDVDENINAEVDDAWVRLREQLIEELNRLGDEQGTDIDEMAEAIEVLAEALAERIVTNLEG